MSISQCQYQFKHRRWNCSAQSPENVFGKIVKIGKDSSFQTLGERFSLSYRLYVSNLSFRIYVS